MGLTTIGNVRRKIGEVRVRGSRDMLADQQTDRESHTHTHTHTHTWGLAAGYQPRPHLVDRGTTTRYGGQLRYKRVSSPDK